MTHPQDPQNFDDFKDSDCARCPHDKENPWFQLSRALVRDESISPQCRWLITYLLSMNDKWVVKVSQVAAHLKKYMCKETVYKLFKEACDAGYIYRKKYIVGGLKRYKYFYSEEPRFKKCLPCTEKPDTVSPDTVFSDTKDKQISPKGEKDKQYKEGSEVPLSAEAAPLVDFFEEKIKQKKPDFRKIEKKSWLVQMDRLIRIDKRDPQRIRQIIEWALSSRRWIGWVLSVEKLRKRFDEIEIDCDNSKISERIESNRRYAMEIREKHPQELKAMTFDKNYVINTAAGKEVPFSLPEETFKDAFLSMFGGGREK